MKRILMEAVLTQSTQEAGGFLITVVPARVVQVIFKESGLIIPSPTNLGTPLI